MSKFRNQSILAQRKNFEENKNFKPFEETDKDKRERLEKLRWPKEVTDIEIKDYLCLTSHGVGNSGFTDN